MPMKMTPTPTPETAVFWAKAAEGELWLPRCVDTGRFFFPPREFSPFTGGKIDWARASGLASFIIAHRPAPGFEAEAPYIIALAELEEGPRLMTNLPGSKPDPAALKIGAPLEVVFEAQGDAVLPQFRVVGP